MKEPRVNAVDVESYSASRKCTTFSDLIMGISVHTALPFDHLD